MTAPWSFVGAPDTHGDGEAVLMEGTTFCVSDGHGDLGDRPADGLFVRDTRVLSTWRLTLEQRSLQPLRMHQEAPYGATFLLFSPARPEAEETDLVVRRDRFVGDGMREQLTVRNASAGATRITVCLEVHADFADVFEVKDGRARPPTGIEVGVDPTGLRLRTLRDGATYGVEVVPDGEARVEAGGMRWTVDLTGHGSWSTSVQVVPELRGQRLTPHHQPGAPVEHAAPARRHRAFRSNAPSLATADPALAGALARSIDDLATLRIFDPERPEQPVIAAGAPWFMALFGRDSLITSLMLLPVDPGLALGTLSTLSAHLGRVTDPVTEEQPGRVPHELRFGPAGTLALGGRNAYYGSADATPLFVVALGELRRWDPGAVGPELVEAADRALLWMTTDGDPDRDGFIEYQRATEQGLVNQGWKDSWDGVNHADGRIADAPIALAEVQAYSYAAYRARAEIAEAGGDAASATRWRDRAGELKESFNRAFWLPERGWYAVALDGDHRPVDALTSNVGHCLWTGIADEDKAEQVAAHLMSPQMFTGWGIRTLGSEMGAFNPMSYHNGSVWPHDTAICASGLMRYGHVEQAARVATALLDASAAFGGRLPELFAGFSRTDFPAPIPYPAACSPQAWAAAAPLELLRMLLRLEPGADGLTCRPAIPARLLPLQLRRVACAGARYDIDVDEHGWEIRETEQGVTQGPTQGVTQGVTT